MEQAFGETDNLSNGFQASCSSERDDDLSSCSSIKEVPEPVDYSSADDETQFFESCSGVKPNKVDCGVQTSASYFNKVKQSAAYKSDQEDKAYSTDWELSGIYDDL